MLPLQTLLIASLSMLIQCTELHQCSKHASDYNHSPVLDSLQCYNDYTSHVRCTWEEDPHTNYPTLMTTKGPPCVSDNHRLQLPNGKLQWSCVHKSGFCMSCSHTFFFNTLCPTEATSINIAAQGKVLTPLNLTEREINGGDRLLSWRSPYPPSSPLTHELSYQLKYRRHGHDWTVVDQLTTSEWKIESGVLLPGYSYEAQVRAQGSVGLWSDWSPPVVWITTKEGVFNLQCVIKEDGVVCSWQVIRQHAEFLSYYLCWNINKTSVDCKLCDVHDMLSHSKAVLDFKCSVYSSEPQMLTVELRSIQKSKSFMDPYNIQPPQPLPVQVKQKDGGWKLSWSRPNVEKNVILTYQMRLQKNCTQDQEIFNLTEKEFIFDVPSYSLMPSTVYMAQVRAVPSQVFSGRTSDWSEPTYFTSDPASWTNTIIYIFTVLFVTAFFILLYTALPVCHRRMEMWNVSIPSPSNSKALQDMSNKKSSVSMDNPYSDKEKTLCFIQASDNPSMGSISEYPILSFDNDSDMKFTLTKSGWLHSSCPFSSHTDGGKVIDKSVVSFAGPYILCRQDSSVPSETSNVSFYSNSSLDEEEKSESPVESSPIYGGYVLSASHATVPLEHSKPFDNPASDNRENSWAEFPADDPPAYTPSTAGIPSSIFSHPSGYCVMPNMEMSVK